MKERLGQKCMFMAIFNMPSFLKYTDFVLFLSYVFKILHFDLQFSTILKKYFNMQAPDSVKLVT